MIQIGSYTIQYNRPARAWTAQNGRFSKSFQTGSVGKQQAIRYAIREAYPAVAQAVAHLCQQNANATGRAWAAATLLVTGHVLTPTEADGPDCLARVLSQRPRIPPDWYRLTYTEMGFGCDCPDFAQGGVVVAEQLLCKHLLAYRLARHLNWALATESPVPLRPKRISGGKWRGRIATRVGTPHPQPITTDGIPRFQSGEPVVRTQETAYAAYVAAIGQPPFNAEKLMSWYLGR